jgi:predicted esterase
MKSILFLSGVSVPKFLSKSYFYWNDSFWKSYDRKYYSSKLPFTNLIVEKELLNLNSLIKNYDVVAGYSLGAWWLSNLMTHYDLKISKLILLNPLTHIKNRSFGNLISYYHPLNNPNKVLVGYGDDDLITPLNHSYDIIKHFNAFSYELRGGHIYQHNHQEFLLFMRDWLDI